MIGDPTTKSSRQVFALSFKTSRMGNYVSLYYHKAVVADINRALLHANVRVHKIKLQLASLLTAQCYHHCCLFNIFHLGIER